MIMPVAVAIHGSDIDRVIETYNLMSRFPHSLQCRYTETQLSSCFFVAMKEDSIEGIYETLKNCAMISKTAGGIGLSIHCIRAMGFMRFIFSFLFSTLNQYLRIVLPYEWRQRGQHGRKPTVGDKRARDASCLEPQVCFFSFLLCLLY